MTTSTATATATTATSTSSSATSPSCSAGSMTMATASFPNVTIDNTATTTTATDNTTTTSNSTTTATTTTGASRCSVSAPRSFTRNQQTTATTTTATTIETDVGRASHFLRCVIRGCQLTIDVPSALLEPERAHQLHPRHQETIFSLLVREFRLCDLINRLIFVDEFNKILPRGVSHAVFSPTTLTDYLKLASLVPEGTNLATAPIMSRNLLVCTPTWLTTHYVQPLMRHSSTDASPTTAPTSATTTTLAAATPAPIVQTQSQMQTTTANADIDIHIAAITAAADLDRRIRRQRQRRRRREQQQQRRQQLQQQQQQLPPIPPQQAYLEQGQSAPVASLTSATTQQQPEELVGESPQVRAPPARLPRGSSTNKRKRMDDDCSAVKKRFPYGSSKTSSSPSSSSSCCSSSSKSQDGDDEQQDVAESIPLAVAVPIDEPSSNNNYAANAMFLPGQFVRLYGLVYTNLNEALGVVEERIGDRVLVRIPGDPRSYSVSPDNLIITEGSISQHLVPLL